MQLPFCVAMACWGVFKAANIATETYAGLSIGASDLIHAFGSAEQRARWLPALLDGRFSGTMVLTEPQAGSSLADIHASATPRADGTYSIRASKIFVTAGDHELTQNIVHLVLARLPDAPPGVKGISLFIVPKRRVHADGSVGADNDVALAGLIHKMGCRGTTSAFLSFGERGECIGELIGKPNQGLACMFKMMNEARIGVGLGATMLALAGYRQSLAYARERTQGRHGKNVGERPVPIVEHADVRRMLLTQKAIAEGALALSLYGAWLVDEAQTAPQAQARRDAGLLLDLLTPVIKSWPSQWGLVANELAIQVHGGYGYTRDFPVEQHYRDNRLNAIHEGTNGIQALDLLGRKAVMDGGAALQLLVREIEVTTRAATDHADEELRAHADALRAATDELTLTTQVLAARLPTDPRSALANASPYMEAFGHTVVAWLWLRQALVAASDNDCHRGKRAAARWFYRWELPRVHTLHERLRDFDPSWLEMRNEWF